jgi:hypothetical protein
MTKEENPKTKNGISLFLGKRKPRASHIPTARLLLLSSLQHPIKVNQGPNHGCAARYFPDLPTDSSEEAKKFIKVNWLTP